MPMERGGFLRGWCAWQRNPRATVWLWLLLMTPAAEGALYWAYVPSPPVLDASVWGRETRIAYNQTTIHRVWNYTGLGTGRVLCLGNNIPAVYGGCYNTTNLNNTGGYVSNGRNGENSGLGHKLTQSLLNKTVTTCVTGTNVILKGNSSEKNMNITWTKVTVTQGNETCHNVTCFNTICFNCNLADWVGTLGEEKLMIVLHQPPFVLVSAIIAVVITQNVQTAQFTDNVVHNMSQLMSTQKMIGLKVKQS